MLAEKETTEYELRENLYRVSSDKARNDEEVLRLRRDNEDLR